MQIAIDGPVGAGKTVVGWRLAGRLGYRFLDTGLMYRAVTLAALDRGTDFESDEALAEVANALAFEMREGEEADRLLVDGEDVTDRLRRTEVEANVSRVSAVPGVRAALVNAQREMADNGGIVMVGRDIGTVVLPGADLKVFLDASQDTRAKRRTDETPGARYENVLESLIRRDRIDSGRTVSPLRAAEDAQVIDTDGMTIDEVVEHIMSLAHARKAG
jgi:cytidylate kinase